jgi:hypothetical protein
LLVASASDVVVPALFFVALASDVGVPALFL